MDSQKLYSLMIRLYGEKDEMRQGKEIVKLSMRRFEEKCHDGKEEHPALGTAAGGKTRMLGTWVGRRQDLNQRKKGEDMLL